MNAMIDLLLQKAYLIHQPFGSVRTIYRTGDWYGPIIVARGPTAGMGFASINAGELYGYREAPYFYRFSHISIISE